MAIAEVIYATIGQAVVRALIRAWTGDIDLVTDAGGAAADLLARAGLEGRDRRRVVRELDEITEQVSDRLSLFFEAERYGGLPENERTAAAIAIASTVDAGFCQRDVVIASDLNATRLEAALRHARPRAAEDALLDPLAIRLYDIALAETCAYLVQMTGDLPRFQTQAFAEVLARERSIVELLTTALENLPRTDDERGLEFETRYLRQVAHQLDRVELLGFGAVASRRYALSVAYISLSATGTQVGDETGADDLEGAVADAFEDELDSPRDDSSTDDSERSARIEEILASTTRLLVKGEAGSGKTTLLQWLAVNAAKSSFDGVLTHLNRRVPLFIQLRRFANAPLPEPSGFIDQVASVVRGYMPSGWVEEQLAAGRAMVLIDGVDELPPERRGEVHDWLAGLCLQFPSATYVVTSRPPAVEDGWLEGEAFEQSLLDPMSMDDVNAFIEHWYDAALPEQERLGTVSEAGELLRTIRRSAPLRRLATSPLLCAMLCALNREGEQQLPSDRIELYDLALDALLERRDAYRRVVADEKLRLSKRQKEILLQELAYWLVRNGYTDAPKGLVLETLRPIVERVAPNSTPAQIYRYLLERTGLLREPAERRLDFIHRTFLEYLAARQAVAASDFGVLIEHAGDDTWDEIVVLAAGICGPSSRLDFLQSLLSRADSLYGEMRQRLRLLAVSCLDTVPELEPVLRVRLESVLRSLIPPETIAAAYDLAAAGELAVPLLARASRMRAVQARASIRTLSLIGTDAALDQLATYGDDDRKTVIRELQRQWSNFDHVEYAERVMSRSPLDKSGIRARGHDLRALPYLQNLRFLIVSAGEDAIDTASLSRCRHLEQVIVDSARELSDLGSLGSHPDLATLELIRCSDLTSLRGIENTGVSSLIVSEAPELRSLDGIAHAPGQLTNLSLFGVGVTDLEPLTTQPRLESFSIRTSVVDSLVPVAELSFLRHASLSLDQDIELFPLIEAENLKSLLVSSGHGTIEFAPLGSHVNGKGTLEQLTLQRCWHIVDLSPLQAVGRIRRLSILGCPLRDLRGGEALAPTDLAIQSEALETLSGLPSSLERLTLRSVSSLGSLSGLANAPSLKSVSIESAPALTSVAEVAELPALQQLTLSGDLSPELDVTALDERPDLHRLHVSSSSSQRVWRSRTGLRTTQPRAVFRRRSTYLWAP